MRSVYTTTVSIAGVNTQKTLLYLTAPSSMVIEILSASITSSDSTTGEQLKAGFFRVTSLSPTPTATTLTPVAHEAGSGASAVSAFGNVTANEPTYAADPVYLESWLNLSGLLYDPIPESRILVPPGGSIGLKMAKSAANAFGCTATITYREIG